MSASRTEGPLQRGSYWLWEERLPGVEVRFVGRGPDRPREEVLDAVEGGALRLAWARQIHSARVLAARAGDCGEGDALWTEEPALALAVATADCVPVVIAGEGIVAAVHAGWRGIAADVVGRTIAALPGPPARLEALIGPAIGPCCYEVGAEVAEQIAAASAPEVVRASEGGRPHLDLPSAVARQLARAGVGTVRRLSACTRCEPERLWSFRRDGPGSGRNLAFAWLRPWRPAG